MGMPDLIAYGHVENGKLKLNSRSAFEEGVRNLKDGVYILSLNKDKPPKSRQLERWIHGIAVQMIAAETGNEPNDVWEFLKLKFRPTPVMMNGELAFVGRSTAAPAMTLEEQTLFKDQIQAWAAEFLNLNIPDPNETDA